MACFSWLFVILSITHLINCVSTRQCTCQKATKMECESAGIVSYDGVPQCTWEPTHERCRNTNWLECKKDPYCLWIKRTVDNVDDEVDCDEDTKDEYQQSQSQRDQSDHYLIYEYSADSPHESHSHSHSHKDQKEMMIESNASILSSIHTQSAHIRIFALTAVIIFVCFAGMYHSYQTNSKKRKDGIVSGSQYSTF